MIPKAKFQTRWFYPFVLVCLAFGVSGCGTMQNKRAWGQDAIWPLKSESFKRGFQRALTSKNTWIPAAIGTYFALDDHDEKLSRWATTKQPIFSNTARAKDAAKISRRLLNAEGLLSNFMTPSSADPWIWLFSKAKGVSVYFGIRTGNKLTAKAIQASAKRTTPDRSNIESFPSDHAWDSASFAALASNNLSFIQGISENEHRVLEGVNTALVYTSGWGRIEAGKAFPTDVFFGIAAGNFITNFLYYSLMGVPDLDEIKDKEEFEKKMEQEMNALILPQRDTYGLTLTFRY